MTQGRRRGFTSSTPTHGHTQAYESGSPPRFNSTSHIDLIHEQQQQQQQKQQQHQHSPAPCTSSSTTLIEENTDAKSCPPHDSLMTATSAVNSNQQSHQQQSTMLLSSNTHGPASRASISSRIWFVKDVCGLICAIFTWLLILYAQYVVLVVILIPDDMGPYKILNTLLYEALTFLAITSHLRTMFTDPVR